MSVSGLNHYNLRAPRELLDRLKAFYCDVVGLQEGPRPPFRSDGHWLYAGDRDVLHLTVAAADESRATGVATTFDHVAFTCADFAVTLARLEALGIEFEADEVASLTQKQLFLSDPAGNGIELNFAMGAQSTDSDGAHGA